MMWQFSLWHTPLNAYTFEIRVGEWNLRADYTNWMHCTARNFPRNRCTRTKPHFQTVNAVKIEFAISFDFKKLIKEPRWHCLLHYYVRRMLMRLHTVDKRGMKWQMNSWCLKIQTTHMCLICSLFFDQTFVYHLSWAILQGFAKWSMGFESSMWWNWIKTFIKMLPTTTMLKYQYKSSESTQMPIFINFPKQLWILEAFRIVSMMRVKI